MITSMTPTRNIEVKICELASGKGFTKKTGIGKIGSGACTRIGFDFGDVISEVFPISGYIIGNTMLGIAANY